MTVVPKAKAAVDWYTLDRTQSSEHHLSAFSPSPKLPYLPQPQAYNCTEDTVVSLGLVLAGFEQGISTTPQAPKSVSKGLQ